MTILPEEDLSEETEALHSLGSFGSDVEPNGKAQGQASSQVSVDLDYMHCS